MYQISYKNVRIYHTTEMYIYIHFDDVNSRQYVLLFIIAYRIMILFFIRIQYTNLCSCAICILVTANQMCESNGLHYTLSPCISTRLCCESLPRYIIPYYVIGGGGGRCYDLRNSREASEVTEGKSSRMR